MKTHNYASEIQDDNSNHTAWMKANVDPGIGDEPVKKPEKPVSKKRGYKPSEILAWEDPKWLVEGHLVENTLAAVFGPPGSFKSFYALDLALSVATGEKFLGKYEVQKGPVVYVFAEGKAGVKQRFQAWAEDRQVDLETANDEICIVPHSFAFSGEGEEVDDLLRVLNEVLGKKPALVILDTLSRNFGSGDENSTKDMKAFVDLCDKVRDATGGVVLVVHHTGKDLSKKERGSNVLRASADTLVQVDRNKDQATVSCEKQKDGEPFPVYDVQARKVGNSLVLEPIDYEPGRTESLGKIGKRDKQRIADCFYLAHVGRYEEEAIHAGDLGRKANKPVETCRKKLDCLFQRGLLNRHEGERGKNPHRYWLNDSSLAMLMNYQAERMANAGETI